LMRRRRSSRCLGLLVIALICTKLTWRRTNNWRTYICASGVCCVYRAVLVHHDTRHLRAAFFVSQRGQRKRIAVASCARPVRCCPVTIRSGLASASTMRRPFWLNRRKLFLVAPAQAASTNYARCRR
jgi:hypothetical protein